MGRERGRHRDRADRGGHRDALVLFHLVHEKFLSTDRTMSAIAKAIPRTAPGMPRSSATMPNLSPHTGAHPDVAESCNRAQLRTMNRGPRYANDFWITDMPDAVAGALEEILLRS